MLLRCLQYVLPSRNAQREDQNLSLDSNRLEDVAVSGTGSPLAAKAVVEEDEAEHKRKPKTKTAKIKRHGDQFMFKSGTLLSCTLLMSQPLERCPKTKTGNVSQKLRTMTEL